MTSVRKISLLAIAVTFLLVTPAAFADGTANLELTGVGNNGAAYGVYVGPYEATINGVSTPVICDDFSHESYLWQPWVADVTSVANPTGERFAAGNYDEVAYLSNLLFNVSGNNSEADALQYAIWYINDWTGVTAFLGASNPFLTDTSDPNGVMYWVNLAEGQKYSPGEYANFLIYTPSPGGSGSPQEFIVETPEPSTILLLGLGVGALCFMKRRVRLASPIQA